VAGKYIHNFGQNSENLITIMYLDASATHPSYAFDLVAGRSTEEV
jgi:hypothetical protein